MNKLLISVAILCGIFLMIPKPTSGKLCIGCLWGYDNKQTTYKKLQDANGILYDAFVATKKNLQGRGQLILKDLMRIVHCTRNNYTHKPPRKGTDYEAIYKEFMEEIFDRLGISKKDYYKDFTESIDNAISLSICKRNCAEYKGYSETISELALTESADDIFMYTFKYYTRLSPRTNDYFFYAVRARVEIVLKKRGCPKDYAEL